jgi:hypothetical protein
MYIYDCSTTSPLNKAIDKFLVRKEIKPTRIATTISKLRSNFFIRAIIRQLSKSNIAASKGTGIKNNIADSGEITANTIKAKPITRERVSKII